MSLLFDTKYPDQFSALIEWDQLDPFSKVRQKKKCGEGYLGGSPPYGWIVRFSTLVEYEPEQKIIREIYSLRRKGLRLGEIAEYLNQQGHETKRGRRWGPKPVAAVLRGVPEVVIRTSQSEGDK